MKNVSWKYFQKRHYAGLFTSVLCTLLAGSNSSLLKLGKKIAFDKIILHCQILSNWNCNNEQIKIINSYKNCYCRGKKIVPATSLPGKKIVPGTKLSGEKIVLSVTQIAPGGAVFLLHIQDAGYKFATAPFSSRPGGYKGAIDRKKMVQPKSAKKFV